MHMILDHAEKLPAYNSANQKLILNAILKIVAVFFKRCYKTRKDNMLC